MKVEDGHVRRARETPLFWQQRRRRRAGSGLNEAAGILEPLAVAAAGNLLPSRGSGSGLYAGILESRPLVATDGVETL